VFGHVIGFRRDVVMNS